MTEGHYAEKLWRMKRPMWCFRAVSGSGVESPRAIETAMKRDTGGTPVPQFTFGSFAFNKTTPEMMAVWVRILKEAAGSRLRSRGLALPAATNAVVKELDPNRSN
jgi:predicted O-linked N-acetylglucosamine transferase (SPINDLY family)